MHVAVLGATGAVGRTMLRVLAEREFPIDELSLLASPRSAGTRLPCGDREYEVRAAGEGCFDGVDIALFSAGADRSREWAPKAAAAGATVIDNSSAWRMDPEVPLVVPEVNADALHDIPKGIVANPNCSTIQVVAAIAPLHRAIGATRVVMTTFQSVSGAGATGSAALETELSGEVPADSPFPRPIAGNVIPRIGDFDDTGWTGEERKMMNETRKILGAPGIRIAATCVRVPVDIGHSVEVAVEFGRAASAEEALSILSDAPGIELSGEAQAFPTALETAGSDAVFVGRVRRDPDLPNVLHLWVVADNLRKGAATNAVQIAERLVHG